MGKPGKLVESQHIMKERKHKVPKITDEPLEAIQVRLFQKDLNALRKLYRGSFGVNKAVRTIVHAFVTQTEARANAAIDELEANETLGAAWDE